MLEFNRPFKIVAGDAKGRAKLMEFFNKITYAESDRGSLEIRVMASGESPVTVQQIASASNLISSISSQYYSGMKKMVEDHMMGMAKQAAAKAGGHKMSSP